MTTPMIAGSIHAGRSSRGSRSARVVDGGRAGADGGTVGALVPDATDSAGASFGVHAGVAIGDQVCWVGAGAAAAGGVGW